MKIETYTKQISTDEYLRDYVNVSEFLDKCKACPNYNTRWSCPEFDFDSEDYFKKYTYLNIVGKKIIFDSSEKPHWRNLLELVKQQLTDDLFAEEKNHPGSISLSAGSCSICGDVCPRAKKKPCIHPDKMRYSIESLGGNVGLTASKLLNTPLQWINSEEIPDYFVLVGGLLFN